MARNRPKAVIRRLTGAAVFAAVIATAAPAGASAVVTDQSDLWWNSGESGWGVQLVHRGTAIFATLFVYDAEGKPIWVVAVLRPAGNAWSGDLYVASGGAAAWFGASRFDSKSVTLRGAGTMTWSSIDGASGTLSYTIDGTPVQKSLVRQPIDVDDYSGSYAGRLSARNSCSGNHEEFIDAVVTQVGARASINWSTQGSHSTCSYSGDLAQAGQFGQLSGTFQCTGVHDDGDFRFFEMRVTPFALTARYESSDEDTGCSTSGYIALARLR